MGIQGIYTDFCKDVYIYIYICVYVGVGVPRTKINLILFI